MKKTLLNGRLVIEGGFTSYEVYITRKIARHKLNRHLSLNTGWQTSLQSDTCGGLPKPQPPKGQEGDYICLGDVWVWVPAV